MATQWDLIIIGYGAAGMMAAAHADGLRTLVLEKNSAAGKKVLISGKGQCNFTHDEPLNSFMMHFGGHKNFVKHAIGKFTPERTRQWFNERGVDSIVMDNGKVFPKSLQAGDLVAAMVREALEIGVKMNFNEAVTQILEVSDKASEEKGEALFEVTTTKECYLTSHVLICTGGFTYAVTGSDGDGYKFAQQLGHALETPRSALAPIYHQITALKALAGVSIIEAQIVHVRAGKQLQTLSGDLLFTHKGLSGPVILNNSRDFLTGDVLKLRFVNLDGQQLSKELTDMAGTHGKNSVKAYLRQICFSKSMADQLYAIAELDEQLTFAQMSKAQRQRIVTTLTAFEVPIDQVGGRQIGMVTAGGVALTGVRAKSMQSVNCPGLYFAGEVLDVDGDTGGYNIQWAFSSGVAAVSNIIGQAK